MFIKTLDGQILNFEHIRRFGIDSEKGEVYIETSSGAIEVILDSMDIPFLLFCYNQIWHQIKIYEDIDLEEIINRYYTYGGIEDDFVR